MSLDKQNPPENVYLCWMASLNVLTKQSIDKQLSLVLIDTSTKTEIRQQK